MKKRRELFFSHVQASVILICFETAKNIRRCKMAILFSVSPCAVADATGCLTIESNHLQSRESGIAPLIIHSPRCGFVSLIRNTHWLFDRKRENRSAESRE
jgi:hypothetical protein